MFDIEPKRARMHGVVHEAGFCLHRGIEPALHPLCDPKVRWDPRFETQQQAVTCFECLATQTWLDVFMAGMPRHEYYELHQTRAVIRRRDAAKKTVR